MVTTGSDTNSGSTTDNTAPVATTNGNWGGSNTLNRFTAAAGTPFSTTLVGQYASVYVDTASFSMFVASIVAVDVGGTYIDLDTTTIKYGLSPSTGTTGRSCRVGGAWATLGITATIFGTGTSPQPTRVNVKVGTYANTTNVRTITMNGAATAPIWWRGYKTVIGDQENNYAAVPGVDIPTCTWTTGDFVNSGQHSIFSNLSFTSAINSTNATFRLNASFCKIYHCRIINTNATANGYAMSMSAAATGAFLVASYLQATATATNILAVLVSGSQVLGNVFSGGVTAVSENNTCSVRRNLFLNQAGDAVSVSASSALQDFDGNTIYGAGGNGFLFSNVTVPITVTNNLFVNITGASKAAINNATGSNTTFIGISGNAYYNVTGQYAGITENLVEIDGSVLNDNPLKKVADSDYTPNYPGINNATPNLFENVTNYQSYSDAGAVQHQNIPGGSYGVSQ